MRGAVRRRSSGDTPEPGASESASPWRSSISWPWSPSPRLRGEGHAEEFEQALRLLVGLRRRHDADLQPAETVHLVVVDLREGELLPEAERIVAAAVERPARHAAEIADPGQGERRQAVEEVPHPIAAKSDLRADRIAG